MTYEPHKQWELLLRVAIAQGDLDTIQRTLGALKKHERGTACDEKRDGRKAA